MEKDIVGLTISPERTCADTRMVLKVMRPVLPGGIHFSI